MSASSLMMLGIKAMAANYAALQTTGHNIANANVDGYSRQRELATAGPVHGCRLSAGCGCGHGARAHISS
jgi:flagellar hook-associated protein FlgK